MGWRRMKARLELTWTNKQLRRLAHEDGSYEWVQPGDYRVSEVRLLDDTGGVGEVGRDRAGDNLFIRGDALNALDEPHPTAGVGEQPAFAVVNFAPSKD